MTNLGIIKIYLKYYAKKIWELAYSKMQKEIWKTRINLSSDQEQNPKKIWKVRNESKK